MTISDFHLETMTHISGDKNLKENIITVVSHFYKQSKVCTLWPSQPAFQNLSKDKSHS